VILRVTKVINITAKERKEEFLLISEAAKYLKCTGRFLFGLNNKRIIDMYVANNGFKYFLKKDVLSLHKDPVALKPFPFMGIKLFK
jgi:hypothetical protein